MLTMSSKDFHIKSGNGLPLRTASRPLRQLFKGRNHRYGEVPASVPFHTQKRLLGYVSPNLRDWKTQLAFSTVIILLNTLKIFDWQ